MSANSESEKKSVVGDEKKEYKARDVIHSVLLKYTAPVFNAGIVFGLFAIPAPVGAFHLYWARNIAYYGWYAYPALKDFSSLGSEYVQTKSNYKKKTFSELESLGSIASRIFVSTSFMASVIWIGGLVSGRWQMPTALTSALQRITPSVVSSIASKAQIALVNNVSSHSLQFMALNSACFLSFILHYINLLYYFGKIPDYLRQAYAKIIESAIAIAKLREEAEEAEEKEKNKKNEKSV